MDTENIRLTKLLRDAALRCSNIEYRALLSGTATVLGEAILDFDEDATKANLIHLNGAWALGERVLNNVPQEAPPAPLSGHTEPARLAA